MAYIADELNLSSPETKARIERALNVRYKQVTSAIGMVGSRREELSKLATTGNQYLTFTGAEKLDAVFRKVGTKNVLLDQITDDDMLEATLQTSLPTKYSIYSFTPTTVTIRMNCIPVASVPFTLYANGIGDVITLSGTTSPAFPESFHDVLIYGVCADEYRRKEKVAFVKEAEENFARRLSDLKMFIAKSAYLTLYRGKNQPGEGWWDTGTGSN